MGYYLKEGGDKRSKDPEVAKEIIKRYESLKTDRSVWESHWQELKELVRPEASDFLSSAIQGDHRHNLIYDGTPAWSLDQLASGLHSYLTSPTDRWYNLTVSEEELLQDYDALSWLEMVSDKMYWMYSRPAVVLNPMLHENYLDLGAFGTSVMYQDWNIKQRRIQFKTFPLASCYLAENAMGIIDTIFRKEELTTRQAFQLFGQDALPDKIRMERNPDKCWNFVHCVYPRSDRNLWLPNATNMPFASYWICENPGEVVEETGFLEFPYHCPRWTKVAGESYGRSPAMSCLPDIKMLNAMQKVLIKANQKVVDPPLIVPNDGFMLPLDTTPSSLIFKEPGVENITPLITNARIDLGLEHISQLRDQIGRCFYIDLMRMRQKNERQTTTEILELREDQLRTMAPMLGRLQAELQGPMLKRTYNLMQRYGMIPPAPEALLDRKIEIEYISPAARAQQGTKAAAIQRFFQDVIPVAQISPEVWDRIDSDALISELAVMRDVSRKIIRSDEQVAQIRGARAQQQQMAAMTQQGAQAAGAIKDLASAAASVPQLSGLEP